MMKFELGDDEMTECTNARAKLYAYLYQNPNNEIHKSKRAKGTKKCITKRELSYQDFKDSVENDTIKKTYNIDLNQIITISLLKKYQ